MVDANVTEAVLGFTLRYNGGRTSRRVCDFLDRLKTNDEITS